MDKHEGKKDAAIKAAKQYVNRQLTIMKQHGSKPKLSATDYDELVSQIAKAAR